MLAAVNANQDELILERKGGDLVSIDFDAGLPLEKASYGQRPGIIAKGPLRVEFDQKFRVWVPKCIFARRLFFEYRGRRNARLIAEADHEFRRAQDVLVAHDEVE